ncbi:hypothetical protein H101_01640 [Trichophyton interdigitale H6]|nr:hypothetical protein H101_01640 [Trichophyton interdigitale H6]
MDRVQAISVSIYSVERSSLLLPTHRAIISSVLAQWLGYPWPPDPKTPPRKRRREKHRGQALISQTSLAPLVHLSSWSNHSGRVFAVLGGFVTSTSNTFSVLGVEAKRGRVYLLSGAASKDGN